MTSIASPPVVASTDRPREAGCAYGRTAQHAAIGAQIAALGGPSGESASEHLQIGADFFDSRDFAKQPDGDVSLNFAVDVASNTQDSAYGVNLELASNE